MLSATSEGDTETKVFYKDQEGHLYPQKTIDDYNKAVTQALTLLKIDSSLMTRCVNVGLSGGEKKISEIIQLLVLQPSFVIFDEIDSGLDSDALKRVIDALVWYRVHNPKATMLFISHYKTLFDVLCPDRVFIMHKGSLIKEGDFSLISIIEKCGYDGFI